MMTSSYKRSPPAATDSNIRSGKRRARYVPQACDACRRRKGRCNGERPCEYCRERSCQCYYSSNSLDRSNVSSSSQVVTAPAQSDSHISTASTQDLLEMVTNLQAQLDMLKNHFSLGTNVQQNQAASLLTREHHSPPAAAPLETDLFYGQISANSGLKRTRKPFQQFCGPTSPDYSLNVAQMKIDNVGSLDMNGPNHRNPSVEESHTDDEDSSRPFDSTKSTTKHSVAQVSARNNLLQYQRLLNMQEIERLFKVYQEVIGELHPVLDIRRLIEQNEGWSLQLRSASADDSGADPETYDMIIVNLVLTVASCAESVSQSTLAFNLYRDCRDIIDNTLAAAATSIKQVVIALLVGFYHFFNYRPRLAWRTCGQAGRMTMELGLHTREAVQRLRSATQKSQVIILSCSLFVLDRQWSAATGLPVNFQEGDFEFALSCPVNPQYLKAMIAFTLISHRFSEPIATVASGKRYEDEDAFELTTFQLQQWTRKALADHKFVHPATLNETSPAETPSSWATILYLRANAVRSMLLRPYFLTQALNTASRTKIQSGLDIVSDTISSLTSLDRSTDIYRKQHPIFQHFLATSCALLLLMTAHAEQNRNDPVFSAQFFKAVSHNFSMALALAASYSSLSRASRKLLQRLLMIKEPLTRAGILCRDDDQPDVSIKYNAHELSNDTNSLRLGHRLSESQPLYYSRYDRDGQILPSSSDPSDPHTLASLAPSNSNLDSIFQGNLDLFDCMQNWNSNEQTDFSSDIGY